ncbi:hypothetical protein EDC24_1619 [Aquisalibacillus elongatus]|uniref:Uncharacterized protein n=1 Tax=Aquisalibacillus elongatus TaxID=485577 RepID=A0A3N5BGL6_9BACI|nr:hypothetical protein EDC24_1619 [Aquisalibacillus elongatus]
MAVNFPTPGFLLPVFNVCEHSYSELTNNSAAYIISALPTRYVQYII